MIIPRAITIESLAEVLHESGRSAVENGLTVAHEKFGEQTKRFIPWSELSEQAKEGRRMQACYLLNIYDIKEKVA